jgi:hypothetical protein
MVARLQVLLALLAAVDRASASEPGEHHFDHTLFPNCTYAPQRSGQATAGGATGKTIINYEA